MKKITWAEIESRVSELQQKYGVNSKVYGVPTKGAIVAGLWCRATGTYPVLTPQEADVILDDIIDSGSTKKHYEQYGKPFEALYTKTPTDGWVVFPWEDDGQKKGEDIVRRMIQLIGDDSSREGVIETPKRVVKSWNHLFSGYHINPNDSVKTFEKGTYNQMIVLKDCEMYSTCEHHMQPFFGKIHIAYIPKDKVIGLSKLARIAECFSRRLQIQERIGEQISDFIMEALDPEGCGVVIEAKHFCVMARGVEKQNSTMVTSSLRGNFLQPQVRQEFLTFVK